MIRKEVLDAMLLAGCSAEQIVAAVAADSEAEAAEAEAKKAAKREKTKTRVRAHRQRNAGNALHDVTKRYETLQKESSPTPPQRKTKNPPSGVKKAHGLADDFQPAESLIEKYVASGWKREAIAYQIDRMRNWASANGIARKDWNAQLRNWLDGAVEKYRGQGPDPRTYAPAGIALPSASRPGGYPSHLPDPDRLKANWIAGRWADTWGPRPDELGCLVPREILDSWQVHTPARNVA